MAIVINKIIHKKEKLEGYNYPLYFYIQEENGKEECIFVKSEGQYISVIIEATDGSLKIKASTSRRFYFTKEYLENHLTTKEVFDVYYKEALNYLKNIEKI